MKQRSKGENKVIKLFIDQFQHYTLKPEYFVKYGGSNLLFDFFVPELKLVIEVQGDQHFTFNSFFHNSNQDLKKQKSRDSLKLQWAEENAISVITFTPKQLETITAEKFRELIIDAV